MTQTKQRSTGAILAVVSLGVFMASLDLFVVNLAFPKIAKAFPGTSLDDLSWVLNAYTIVFAAVLVPAGRWADRIGRRKVFSAGLAIFTIGSALCGIAPGVGLLIAARCLQAVGAGMMLPASLSLLLAVVPPAGRAKAIGLWSAVGALGAGLGPVIGGLLVQVDWRWVFWVNIPVGIAGLILTPRVIPESRDDNESALPDWLAALVLAGAIALLADAIVTAPNDGWISGRTIGLLVAVVAGLALVVYRSAHHPAPVVSLPLLRNRGFSGATLASVAYYGGFGTFVLVTVEFLTGVWHYTPIRAGLAIAPGPLTVLPFARFVAPRLATKLGGAGRVAVIGALVNVAAQSLWLARVGPVPHYAAELLPAQMIGGMGVGLSIPSLLGAGTAEISPAVFGVASGVLNMARQIGTVIGVAGLIGFLQIKSDNVMTPYRHGVIWAIVLFGTTAVVAAVALTKSQTKPQLTAAVSEEENVALSTMTPIEVA